MRLARYGNVGSELPAILDAAGALRSLAGIIPDIDAAAVSDSGLSRLRSIDPQDLPVVEGPIRLGPCIRSVGKVIGVGMNYHCHARQAGVAPPSRPVFFAKPLSSLCGPNDRVVRPAGSLELDWEVELALVIGREVRNVGPDAALSAIAGYCILNDVTERGWIRQSGQLFDGKCGDTFSPLGPWLVTADAVPDPAKLSLKLWLNDELRQDGTTADMIFSPAEIISRLSRITTLRAGDIIATGTPAGVGMRSVPPTYLQPGDRLRLQVEGLGEQLQTISAPDHG
jgi:ureidoglycolate lyase